MPSARAVISQPSPSRRAAYLGLRTWRGTNVNSCPLNCGCKPVTSRRCSDGWSRRSGDREALPELVWPRARRFAEASDSVLVADIDGSAAEARAAELGDGPHRPSN